MKGSVRPARGRVGRQEIENKVEANLQGSQIIHIGRRKFDQNWIIYTIY